jgi:AAHS family 4-hydroxybenzoate transporter-like MFS transporter
MPAAVIKVSDVVDRQPIGSFQLKVFLLCAAILFVEGFDTQAIAYVSPALSKDWGLQRGVLGPVFSAGLFGLLCGSLLVAPLADRIGRRKIIIWSVLLFGSLTLVTAAVTNLTELISMRFITGLGLGGAMANAVALAAEYSPAQRRASIVMAVFTGFPTGSAIGGFVAALMIPTLGWEAVFICGGGLTLALWLVLLLRLPESICFLALTRDRAPQVARLLQRIDRSLDADQAIHFTMDETRATGVTVRHLFSKGWKRITPLLWVIFFMSLLNVYLLASWLPTMIHSRGISVEYAVIATALLQVGGIAGALVLSVFTGRFGAHRIMPCAYLAAAGCIASISLTGSSVGLTMLAVFCAGFTVIGCQNCNNGLASVIYPTSFRATGIGWANGIGRAGSISGPMIAGFMLAGNANLSTIYLTGAAAALCAAIASLAIGKRAMQEFG